VTAAKKTAQPGVGAWASAEGKGLEAEPRAYLRMAAILKKRILDGGCKCGDKLPAEAALSREYGLALMTVRQAVGVLAEQGLVERVPGRGTYVRELSWSRAPFYIDGLVEAVRSSQARVTIIKSEVRKANAQVAARLGLELGDSVIFLRRHVKREEETLLVQEGYLLLDPLRPVVEAELEATYLTGLFTGSGEGLIKKAVLSITPVVLSKGDALVLGREAGAAAFNLEYCFYDAALAPLATGRFVTSENQLKLVAQTGLSG
jgi:GntR family transcriptional regulator